MRTLHGGLGPAGRSGLRRDFGFAVLLLAATFLVYLPALRGEFLLDDDVHVTRPELQSLAGLGRIWTEVGATQQYYPVLHTAFWLEHRLWGDAVLGYHLVNVLLHSVAALLVVALMRRLQRPGGWLAAFVFALHPVAVESVAWISEQKNTLSTVFCLGAALVFLRYVDRRSTGNYVLATGLFIAAVLSKTATASLPAALLVILWWRQGRLGVKRDVAPLMLWFVIALGAGLVTLSVERALIAGIDANLAFTGSERVLVAGRALWFYLGKLVWPANLTFLYERWRVDGADAVQYLFPGLVVVVGLFLLTWSRRARGPLAGLLCFAGTLLPVLGFVNVEWFVFSFVADHFQYLASLGVIIPLAAAATNYANGLAASRQWMGAVIAAAVVASLGTLTWRHSRTFRDPITLYTHATVQSPASPAAHYLLGVALMERPDRTADAVAAFEAALQLNPESADVHARLGEALLRLAGRRREAITHLETAVRAKPSAHSLPTTLAAAWFDEARALAAESGRADDAIAAYERAVELNPNLAEAHFNLGNLLLRRPGQTDAAIAHFQAAVRLKPDFAAAHTNLGTALASIPGRLPEAIAHFETALRVDPDFAPARNNLARARQLR